MSPCRKTFGFLAALTGVTACSFVDLSGLSTSQTALDDGGQRIAPASPPGTGADGGTRADGAAGTEEAYASAVRADRPVAYYRFEEEATASAARDEIGGRTATPDEPVAFGVGGAIGRGVRLDGEAVLDVGDAFDFAGKVPFSFELWTRPERRGSDQILLSKRGDDGTGLRGCILYLGSDLTVHFEVWGASMSAWTNQPITSAAVAPAGLDFIHVVVSISYATGKGNATLYVDGQAAPNGGYDNTDDIPNTNTPFVFGRDLRGTLDEIAVYDHELSSDRVLAHYLAGRR